MEAIAKVKLSPGEVGFFDELTRIHLTIANPEAVVYKDMNTENIKVSVASGRLILTGGTLTPEDEVKKAPAKAPAKKVTVKKEEPKEEVKEEPKEEEKKAPAKKAPAKTTAAKKTTTATKTAAKKTEEAKETEADKK